MPRWTDGVIANGTSYYPEAPTGSLDAIAHALLGHIIGGSAFIRRGAKRVYPAIWLLLIGDSGAAKSSVIEYGSTYLENFSDRHIGNPASKEGFEKELYRHSEAGLKDLHWFQPEFGSVFATMENHEGMREDMCLLYDRHPIESIRSKASDSFTVPPLHVTLVGGVTPDTTSEYVTKLDVQQGVVPRVLLNYPDPVAPARMAQDPSVFDAEHARLIAEFHNFQLCMSNVAHPIEFTMTKDAFELFNLWCEDKRQFHNSSFIKRLETYVLRWSVIDVFNDLSNFSLVKVNPVLDVPEIERGLRAIEPYIGYSEKVESLVYEARDYRKVSEAVRTGDIERSWCMNRFHVEAKRMDEIVETARQRLAFREETRDGKSVFTMLKEK